MRLLNSSEPWPETTGAGLEPAAQTNIKIVCATHVGNVKLFKPVRQRLRLDFHEVVAFPIIQDFQMLWSPLCSPVSMPCMMLSRDGSQRSDEQKYIQGCVCCLCLHSQTSRTE